MRAAILALGAFLALAFPSGAQGAGTGHDLINRLVALDAELARLKKDTPGPGTFALGNQISQIADAKERLIKELTADQTAYGVSLSTIFIKFDCADVELRRAGHQIGQNIKPETVDKTIERAVDCLKDAARALGKGGQMPKGMRDELNKLLDKADKVAEKLDDEIKEGEKPKKLEGEKLQKALKRLASKKYLFMLDYFRKGKPDANAAPMSFGILWFDLFIALDSVDVFLVDAEFGDKPKEIDKHIARAIAKKEGLLAALRAVNPTEGHFVTRAKGLEATRICVYLKGPANQKGRVTLTGAAIASTNPANFLLDGGNDMVSFIVQGTGDYTVSIERQLPDGSFKGGETDSVNVPGGGPSAATAPPAGVGYGTQPCPAP